jgi:uncharacterized protein
MAEKLKIAVITEWHPIDVIAFHTLFKSFDEFECYFQALESIADDDVNRAKYDALVFYNLSLKQPESGTAIRRFSEEYLGTTKQGIFLLHHGMLSYSDWPLYDKITGLPDRNFKYHQNQTVRFDIADAGHPITRGMKPWTMKDETYTLPEPDETCHVILTAEHPLSLKSIAWTRQYNQSPVFAYASGHDDLAYTDPNFMEIVRRGVLWCAGKL